MVLCQRTYIRIINPQLLSKHDASDMHAFDRAFQEFFQWLSEHDDELDAEAGAMTDRMLDTVFNSAKKKINSMTDSPLKRETQRIVKKASGAPL